MIDAVDAKEYTGGLIALLQEGIEFVTNNSKKAWKKVNDGRIEMPEYPERAVLEGMVNALIHRSYLQTGSEDFLLTLFNLNYSEKEKVTQENLDMKIRVMIKGNAHVSTKEMAHLLGVNARTIKRHIKEMGDVMYVGSGYSGHWEIRE